MFQRSLQRLSRTWTFARPGRSAQLTSSSSSSLSSTFALSRHMSSAAAAAASGAAPSAAHIKAVGQNILAEANNLKRNTQNLAQDIQVPAEKLEALFRGDSDMDFARDVINRMVDIYPVQLKDLWVEEDDTDMGVKIFPRAASDASSRVMTRVNKEGTFSPYYDYFDTAMSKLGPYRPEKIVELRTVDDADPSNPDVVYNNGHLLHQTTFFVGPVNFYYELNGVRHCIETNTGDSNYITPFVPHSFASRDSSQLAMILACTYAGEVRNVLSDMGRLSPQKLDALAGDARRQEDPFSKTLQRKMKCELMQLGDLQCQLNGKVSPERCQQLYENGHDATVDEAQAIADVLQVPVATLMSNTLLPEQEVVFTRSAEQPERTVGAFYTVKPLARSIHQPDLKSFHLFVHDAKDAAAAAAAKPRDLSCHLHSFYFNYSDQPVDIVWGDRSEKRATVQAGDSIYVYPLVHHEFHPSSSATATAAMYMVRLPGALTESVIREYSNFQSSVPGQGRHRVGAETVCWYQAEK